MTMMIQNFDSMIDVAPEHYGLPIFKITIPKKQRDAGGTARERRMGKIGCESFQNRLN